MNVTVLLADYAQTGKGGKLNALGLGWTRTTTPLVTHAVVLFIEPAPDELDRSQHLAIALVDSAGNAVKDPMSEPVAIEADITAHAIKEQLVPGITAIAVNIAHGLPLIPGTYSWAVELSGSPGTQWTRSFEVVAPE